MIKIKTWSDYNFYAKLNPTSSVELENFLILNLNTKCRDKALNEIIKNNISTVHHYALKYKWSNIAYEDLVQYGIAGIISAADNFDPSKNVRFFTFATHYIIGRIKRALEQHNNIIRIPAHVNLALLRIQDVDPNIEISDEELSKLTTDRYKLHHLRIAIEAKKQKMVDIDDLFDLSSSNNNVIDRKLVIETMMSALNEKEQIALQLKFGLNNNKIHTLAEIDKIIGTDTEYLLIGVYKKLRQKFDANIILELLRDE
jgi:RNA polymerase sigma factor (sigma-70 family)